MISTSVTISLTITMKVLIMMVIIVRGKSMLMTVDHDDEVDFNDDDPCSDCDDIDCKGIWL